jgi:hypothetical protein
MKNISNIGGAFKFVCEIYFNLPIFVVVRWFVPLIYFKKCILTQNFIFLFFVFFMGGESELLDSYEERENFLLMTFLPLNRLNFVSMGSIRWEESYNDCFKSPCSKEKKKQIKVKYEILFFSMIYWFGSLFEFNGLWCWFSWCYKGICKVFVVGIS